MKKVHIRKRDNFMHEMTYCGENRRQSSNRNMWSIMLGQMKMFKPEYLCKMCLRELKVSP